MTGHLLLGSIAVCCAVGHPAQAPSRAQALLRAYPDSIARVTNEHEVVWSDGTRMPLGRITDNIDDPTLADQLAQPYPTGQDYRPRMAPGRDPGRLRYTPFFTKMYGQTEAEVESHLVSVPWLPHVFGPQSMLRVTTVNQVDQKVAAISAALEALPKKYHACLRNPGGTFVWRTIAGTQRQSTHSFGMTLDINVRKSNYWRWDLQRNGLAEAAIDETTPVGYQNQIPWEIVQIFEQHGFIWGGKWHHYDTMHFEYRPELFD